MGAGTGSAAGASAAGSGVGVGVTTGVGVADTLGAGVGTLSSAFAIAIAEPATTTAARAPPAPMTIPLICMAPMVRPASDTRHRREREPMPDRRRYARTPDTVLLLGVLALTAGALTVTGQAPGSVLQLVPRWAALVWSGTLAGGAACALLGVLWRDPLWGWGLELAGRVAVACTCLAYTWALWSAATQPGTALIVAVIAGITAASVARVWQLTRRWRQFVASVEQRGRRR